ncbi:hypothetical protein F2Q69_00029025 [Brassica cretica]|uniref:Uncharacterized protein n=1 Tax=Brassica cretica TaxID=69181 RepID=A0A8S9S480_BRACR|nr:hypothetical protein F2Q69_00029025 [Brassica cretica]
MENMDFGQTLIDEEIGISIDRAKSISIDKSTGTTHIKHRSTTPRRKHQIDFADSHTLKNNHPNPDSFTQNYDATVGSRQGRAKSRLNQDFTGNRKLATDLNGKIDIVFSELMRKFDTLGVQIKRLDNQVAENAATIKRETRRLPGRTDVNPKCQINVVLLRSGKHLIPRAIEINNTEKHAVRKPVKVGHALSTSMIPVPSQKYLEKEGSQTLRKSPSNSRKKKEK